MFFLGASESLSGDWGIINSRQLKPRRIVLIEVDTRAEERAVFQILTPLPPSAAVAIIPVRREFSLVPTIAEIARAQGNLFQVIAFRDFKRRFLDELSQTCDSTSPQDSLAVVPVGDLDPELVFLAHYLSGGPLLRTSDIEDVSRQKIQRVLVIYNGTSPQDQLVGILSQLFHREIPCAVLLLDPVSSGRLAILKTFLFPAVEIKSVDWLEDLHPSSGKAGPNFPTINNVPPPGRKSSKILVSSGHGNAVEIGKGGSIICTRSAAAANSSPGVYPCFSDGLCFRQPIFKRSPESGVGLISPERLHYPVVLLLGCRTLPQGSTPFDASNTILGRINQSHSIAGVATVGIFYADFHAEMLLVALLLDGYCLGDAVLLFNAWYREVYGEHVSPANGGFGPLMAFGNPGFRVRSSLVKTLRCVEEDKGEILISPLPVDFSRDGLAVLKITRLKDSSVKGLYTPAALKGSAVRIASPDDRITPCIYLSLKYRGESKPENPVKLFTFDHQRRNRETSAFRESLGFLSFWRIFLNLVAENTGQKGIDSSDQPWEPVGKCNQIEPLLLRYLSTNLFETKNILPTSDMIAMHDYLMSLWCEWQRAMLEAAALYIKMKGGFTFQLWHNLYCHQPDIRRLRICPYCERENVSLYYRSHLNPSDEHEVIHCSICGVLGELPPSIGVIVRGLEQSYPPGTTVSVHVEVEAKKEIVQIGYFTVLRECWFHHKADIAQTIECRIDPGKKHDILFALKISAGLTGGLYLLTLLGIVNGGLVHLRRHVHISSDLSPGNRKRKNRRK